MHESYGYEANINFLSQLSAITMIESLPSRQHNIDLMNRLENLELQILALYSNLGQETVFNSFGLRYFIHKMRIFNNHKY